MRIGSNMPEELWPETFKTASYLLNRTPSRTLGWKSLFQRLQKVLLQEEEQSLDHLWIFGCRAYALKHKIPRTQKTEARAFIGYLVGYDSMNIFKIWVPSKKKIISTWDVTFKESLFYDSKEINAVGKLYKEIKDIIKVYQLPNIQQQDNNEHSLDMDMDLLQENANKFSNAYKNQQKQNQQINNMEKLIKGIEPMLPTLCSTPEVRNSSSSAVLWEIEPMGMN